MILNQEQSSVLLQALSNLVELLGDTSSADRAHDPVAADRQMEVAKQLLKDIRAPRQALSQPILADFKRAHDLFEAQFAGLNGALSRGDLSLAQFPRVGTEAQIELTARQSQLQWVLEILPNPNVG